MKAGVLSDTHDHLESALAALDLFRGEKVDVVFHLGDVTLPRIIEPFRGNGIPLVAVFGNNDFDKEGLQRASGGAFAKEPRIHEVGGSRVLLGHLFDRLYGEMTPGAGFDLILFGHTHRPVSMRAGGALVVNPGEACGLVSGRHTCAVVDLASREVRIVDLFARWAAEP